jgi:molybdopterin synthase catalytic subunit
VKVKVRYFAFLTDFTGKDSEYLDTDCKNVDCLIDQLKSLYGEEFAKILREGYRGVKVMWLINGKANNKELNEGDEIAFLPPPSGGGIVRKGEINFLEEIHKARNSCPPEAGSMVVYIGFVKGVVNGNKVFKLRYQAYEEYTNKRFNEIINSLKEKYSDLIDIKIYHVIDDMNPGDDVILIIGIGKGRHQTFRAVEEAIELVKNSTGIWKLEVRDDGEFWVVAGNTRVKRIDKASSS